MPSEGGEAEEDSGKGESDVGAVKRARQRTTRRAAAVKAQDWVRRSMAVDRGGDSQQEDDGEESVDEQDGPRSSARVAGHAAVDPAPADGAPNPDETTEERKRRNRERNRMSARKSRQRKKQEMDTLRAHLNAVEGENKHLTAMVDSLYAFIRQHGLQPPPMPFPGQGMHGVMGAAPPPMGAYPQMPPHSLQAPRPQWRSGASAAPGPPPVTAPARMRPRAAVSSAASASPAADASSATVPIARQHRGGGGSSSGNGQVDEQQLAMNLESTKVLRQVDFDLMSQLESERQAFFIVDPRFSTRPIIYASESLMQMYQVSRDAVFGKPFHLLLAREADPNAVAFLEQALNARRDSSVTLRVGGMVGRMQRPFWALLFAAPLRDDQNRVVNEVGVINQVDERAVPDMLQRQAAHLNDVAMRGWQPGQYAAPASPPTRAEAPHHPQQRPHMLHHPYSAHVQQHLHGGHIPGGAQHMKYGMPRTPLGVASSPTVGYYPPGARVAAAPSTSEDAYENQ